VVILVFCLVVVGVVLTLFDLCVGATFGGLGVVALLAAGFSASTKDGWKWFVAGGKPTRALSKTERNLVWAGSGMMGSVLATILGRMVVGF
jgi:hypothetical protein